MDKPRTLKKQLPEKRCVRCGTIFPPYRQWQRYCTPKCRNLHYWETHEVIKTLDGDQVIPSVEALPVQTSQ